MTRKKENPEFYALLEKGDADSLRECMMWLEAEERRIALERDRMQYEETFFEKKMDILKSGFAQLEADRIKLERDKMSFEADRHAADRYSSHIVYEDMAGSLFAGVNNFLALKKRYRDLLKIFHPDNMCGDHEMVTLITKDYERLRAEIDSPFRSVN